jgi:hypothetical protein
MIWVDVEPTGTCECCFKVWQSSLLSRLILWYGSPHDRRLYTGDECEMGTMARLFVYTLHTTPPLPPQSKNSRVSNDVITSDHFSI